MALFPKNSGSKLFASSFAISASNSRSVVDSDPSMHDENLVSVDMVEIKEGLTEPNAVSIAAVIRLIRCLPNQGTEAELFAVLKTLEIFNVDVDYLLSESARKEEVTSNRIKALNSDIRVLEDQIEQRQKEVSILEVGLNELNKVNDCLYLMAKLGESFDNSISDEIVEESTTSDDASVNAENKPDQRDSNSAEDAEISNGINNEDEGMKIIPLDALLSEEGEDDDETKKSGKIKRKKKQDSDVEEVA